MTVSTHSPFCLLAPKGHLLQRAPLEILHELALYRHGESIFRKISEIPLRVGDVLLLQGHRSKIARISQMEQEIVLHVLGSLALEPPNLKRAPVAIFIFIGALGAGALNLLSLPVAVLLGVFLVFLTRCISPGTAYTFSATLTPSFLKTFCLI